MAINHKLLPRLRVCMYVCNVSKKKCNYSNSASGTALVPMIICARYYFVWYTKLKYINQNI